MTTPFETVIEIASRILNQPASALDLDAPLHDLGFDDEEWRDMLEEACEIHDVALIDIINTMPVYRFKRSDQIMHSLIDIAPFSLRATAMLADYTTQMNLDTLRSIAASVEASRYVSSGLMSEDLHQPNTRAWVLGKGFTLTALALGFPLLNAFGPCTPICRDCLAPPSEKFWEIGIYSLPIMLILLILWFGPGLYEIVSDRRKKKLRGTV